MGSDTSPDMDADLVNRGTISAEGGLTSATGVIVGDDVVVHNESLSAIEATGNQPDPMNMDLPAGVPVIGIQLGADTTLENDGRIQTDGAESTAVLVTGGAGSTTTIINGPTGQILTPYDPDDPDVVDDPVDGSVAIQGGDGIEIVTHQGALNGIIDLAGNDDQLTLFTGTSFDVLIGGGGTDALILDGGGAGLLDLDLVSEFESIEIDAMVTDMDAMPPEDFFGTWELQDSTPMSTLSLPDGLTLTNGTLRLRDAVTIDSATGFVMGAGTTFQVLVDPNEMTNGDLVVTNGGNLDLSALDNTLDVIQLAPITASTTITVLESSAGALNGVFENVPMDTPLLAYQVNHLASSVTVDITRFSYGVVAETPNQGAVGEYLDRVLAAGGNSPGVDAVLVVLDALGADQLRNAYDGLHPEAYDAHTGQVAALGRAFAEAAIEPRLRCKPAFFGPDPGPLRDVPCGRSGFTGWMKLLFSESNRDGGGDYFDSDGSRRAVAGGFDWRPDRRVTVTGYIGIGSVDVDVKGVGNGDIQSYEIGGAVAARLGAGRLSATLGYGRGDHEQNRRLDFGAFGTDTIQGNFNSNRIQSMIEAAWLFELGDLQLEPLARMDVTWVQEDAFSESDLGGYELEVDERSEVLFGTQFGGRLRYRHHQSAYADDVIPYTQGTWTPEISASWRSLWSGADRETTARFAGAGDAGDLKVESEDSQQGVDVGAKLTFQPHGSGGSFSIGYDGFFGDKSTDHRFGAALEVYF
ncbi:MAG TPA: autotransporter domain-containing protein [Myxococcota bacterium]|nr:autotransporter domain-containing protein [Myxococcota bacterium]